MDNKFVLFLAGNLFLAIAFCDNISAASQAGSNGNEIKKDFSNLSVEELIETEKDKDSKTGLFFVLENTLRNNKRILSAQKGLTAIEEDRNTALAGFKPTISGELGYDFEHDRRWKSNSGDSSNNQITERSSTTKGGIIVKQNLFKGGADRANLREAEAKIQASWSEYEAIKQEVLTKVASYYFELLAKQKEIEHLKSLLASRESSLQVVSEMYNTGAEKYVSVMQAKAACSETEAQLAKAEAEYKTLCAKFEEETGIPVPAKLTAPAKLFDTNMKEEQALDLAYKFNPKIISANHQVKAAKEAVKKPNSNLYPSVDAYYQYSQSLDSAHKHIAVNPNNRVAHTVGVTMTIPIYDAGVGRSQKRKATELAAKTAVEKDNIVNEIKAGVAEVWATLAAAKRNIISAHTAVEARRLALHDTEEEHKAGVKIMNDVLEAQQKLFEAQFAEIQAQKMYFVAQCHALSLLGRMTPRYLKLKFKDFRAESNYNKN